MLKVSAKQFAVKPVAASVFSAYNACQSSAMQAKFLSHMCVPEIQQFEVRETANDDVLEVDFREMKSIGEKKHWRRKFGKHYVEGVNSVHENMFDTARTKYIAAVANGKNVGFVYLINLQVEYNDHSVNAWRLDSGYVKGHYRSRRVFQQLILHVVSKYNVVEISIEHDRYICNEQYYADLGFTQFVFTDSTTLGLLLHDNHCVVFAQNTLIAA